MRKVTFAYIVFFLTINIHSQTPTLLGTHGGSTPNIAVNLGAQVVRYGFTDYQIKKAFLNESETATINKMKAFDSLGIVQVVYLRWPEDTVEVIGTDFERIPIGADRVEVFQYLETFLIAAGPYLDWIQINQEPLGATKYDYITYTISEVIQWWIAVAQFVRDKQVTHPLELGHLKIMTGGITGIKGAMGSPNSPIAAKIDSIIQFGESYCDAIDLHLHTSSLVEGAAAVKYIKDRTNHPLTCTEWSQAHAAVETGWLNNINTVWVDSSDKYFDLTNAEIMGSAYVVPMDTLDWVDFIAASPYTPNFIPDFYSILDNNCFIMACYAGVWQYGNPRFDWNQLLASKTVTTPLFPNNPFYTEYINLSSLLNSGSYITNCRTTSIDEELENHFGEIYPNPASDIIYIKTDGKYYNAKIFNVLGEEVAGFAIEQSAEINISHLRKGVYIIKIWNNKTTRTSKFIKL
ncbi:MAG: T9SS type A sorting domain-containing protein [Melioribacteraceae bacterium]|nr:T9SS type A sorting domain-containing protein [Melioribacteraceae bacterium]